MTRRTVTVAVLAVVSTAAIAVGAAAIGSAASSSGDDTVIRPPGGSENSSLPGDRGGGEGEALGNRTQADSGLRIQSCVSFLTTIPGTGVYFLAFLGLVAAVRRRYSFGTALLASYGLAPVVFLGYFLATSDCVSAGGPGVGSGESGGGGIPGSGSVVSPPEFAPLLLLGVLGVVLVAVAAFLVSASGDQFVEEDDDEEGPDEADVSAFAAAAGKAADRLEDSSADVDNEVYRAWWEMTTLLDVPNPDSATPREFTEAAVELGIDREDVDELTRLFEEVRYGRRDPASREERAVEVFRDIESEYGTDRAVDFDAGNGDPDADSDAGAEGGNPDADGDVGAGDGDAGAGDADGDGGDADGRGS